MAIIFDKKGHRKHQRSGLYYDSDSDYQLYLSDRLMGFDIEEYKMEVSWLAIFRNRVISRHKTKKASIAACRKHERNQNARSTNTKKAKSASRKGRKKVR